MAQATANRSAFLDDAVNLLVQRLASSEILGFFERRKRNKELLEELTDTLNIVNGQLLGAEERQIANVAVRSWLVNVKDVVYEAEDLLDEIDFEVRRTQLEAADFQGGADDQVGKMLSSLIPFKKQKKDKLFKSLESIFSKLHRLAAVAGPILYGKQVAGEAPPSQSIEANEGPPVYGRDDARKAIVDMILSDDAMESKRLEVILIVGMRGIGKTSLAKLIFNDININQCFDLKAWVYVSQRFDVLKVTKGILKGVGDASNCDYMTVKELHQQLRRILEGKSLLLVLDDVCSEARDAWDFLLKHLEDGARRCMIIVTTRSERVASFSRSARPYHLQGIDDDDCWQLFSKHAFGGENGGAQSGFEKMFRPEIARRCRFQPFAAKLLGSLLKNETDVGKWEEILRSNVWRLRNKKIVPVVAVSYHYLPSHLKRCVAYCGIFPKGYSFRKEELVLLWVAERFLIHPDSNRDMEEVGYECFQELESKSFFQRVSERSPSFVMPDYIHDLAEYLSEEFYFRLDEDAPLVISPKTRHLSCASTRYSDLKSLGRIDEVQNFRTFLSTPKESFYGGYKNEEIQNILPRFKRLRVLSLCNIYELPDSIGDLKYLWYLNLSGTSIKRLPESVSALYHLQILILRRCRDLAELPTNTMKLTNLYYLDIHETKLQQMPPQIGNLTKLQTLTDFFVGKQSGSGIKELGELKCLRGKLCIWNLQNVDVSDALQANFKGMKKLKELTLSWSGDNDASQHGPDILKHLQPHKDVEALAIVGYRGTKLSDWVRDSSLSNIVTLRLSKCKYCPFLPPLGELPSLKSLLIEAFDSVEVVGSEFYGSRTSTEIPFASLESLTFESMPQWREWTFHVGGNEDTAFPRLQVLCIKKCPNLRRTDLPKYRPINKITLSEDFHKVQLEKFSSGLYGLTVDSFHSLDSILNEIELWNCSSTMLQKIDIAHIPSRYFPSELFPNFPKLEKLDISRCPNLEFLVVPSTSLETYEFPALKTLTLSDCSRLESVRCFFPSLVDLKIANCHVLSSFSGVLSSSSSTEVDLSSKLESLHIHSCNQLFAGRKKWDLQRLPSLSSFSLGDCSKVDCFPEKEMPLPSKLTFLGLYSLPKLISLNAEGLQHLTCLKKLKIEDCPELRSLPEGLPF